MSSVPSEVNQTAIEFLDVSYRLATGYELLRHLNLTVHPGETLILLGRSGSGKTTTLKLINHLLAPSAGEVRVQGRSTRDWDVIRLRRTIGYAIQEVGLFPHFTVARNIAVVPQIEHWPAERTRQRVQELMQLVGLDQQLAARYPRELSGGQRQRVGVMDEPFGALDPITRAELQREFRALQERMQKTVVFVTHDLREALRLGTRIALIEAGYLVTVLPVAEFVHSPDPLVADYVDAFDSGPNLGRKRTHP